MPHRTRTVNRISPVKFRSIKFARNVPPGIAGKKILVDWPDVVTSVLSTK